MTERQIIRAIIRHFQKNGDEKETIKKFVDILKEYKSGSNGKEPFHMGCRKAWEKFYIEQKDNTAYYWGAKDAFNLNQLIQKLRFKLGPGKQKDVTEEEFVPLFDRFISGVLKIANTDRHFSFIKEKFTISTLNSHFNELFTKVKQQYNSNSETVRKYEKNMPSNIKKGAFGIDDIMQNMDS